MSIRILYDEPELLTGNLDEDLGKLRVVVYVLPPLYPNADGEVTSFEHSESCAGGVVTLFYEYQVMDEEDSSGIGEWKIRKNEDGNRVYGVALNFDNASNFRAEIVKSAMNTFALFVTERDAKNGKLNDIGGVQAGLATEDQEEESQRNATPQ